MAAKSAKDVQRILQNDFSEKIAIEILDMIDRLADERMDVDKIEKEVVQHLLHHVEQDVNATIRILSGTIRTGKSVKTGPAR